MIFLEMYKRNKKYNANRTSFYNEKKNSLPACMQEDLSIEVNKF